MGFLSKIKEQQCIKEYNRELAAQSYDFEQWRKAQPTFVMEEQYARAAVLYADYIWQGPEPDGAQVPVFLPDFSPNRWDYEDYLGQSVFVRQDYYDSVDWDRTSRRSGLKDIIGRAMEAAGGRSLSGDAVVHIRGFVEEAPEGFVGLTTRPTKGSFKKYPEEALKEAYDAGVSVIIPSKDHPVILRKCLESLAATTEEVPLEIIVVDNGSYKDNRIQVESMCKTITAATDERLQCKYIYEPMDFHFSKMCNMGAEKATGAYLLFLNDDVEAVEQGWLTELLAQAIKPYTGAVGMKLLYPDGERIQHAGIVNLPMGPVHKLQFASDRQVYYDGRNRGVHNVSAVTGACLMMRKALYQELGGMSEALPVAFNDVELCFHAMEKGYYNVVCCDYHLLHHESISRGQDNTEEKRSRLLRERSKLYEMHPKQVSFDAFYPYGAQNAYGLCHAYLDTAIRPAYEDGILNVQRLDREGVIVTDRAGELRAFPQKAEHQKLNPCLKVEVEQLYQETADYIHVAGYSFVVGSDNSRFAYTLVLKGREKVYGIPLKPLRRGDLERNMPDQVRVGLSGFHVELPVRMLAKGKYRVEIYAKDMASGLRLRQGSNLSMHIS